MDSQRPREKTVSNIRRAPQRDTMQALYDGLRDLGVRDERIQAEAFGPSSLKRRPDGTVALPPPAPARRPSGHPSVARC